MTRPDPVVSRMDKALDKAIDMAEEKARERGVSLPPQVIGQMALEMYRARMAMLTQDGRAYDLPDDSGRESW